MVLMQVLLAVLACSSKELPAPPPPPGAQETDDTTPDDTASGDTASDDTAPDDTAPVSDEAVRLESPARDRPATSREVPAELVLLYEGVCEEPDLRVAEGAFYAPEQEGWESPQPEHQSPDETAYAGQGAAVADLNGDGLLDIYLPNVGADLLFIQDARGQLIDESQARLPDIDDGIGTGAVAVDVEGDGDLDLYVATIGGEDILLLNDGAGVFTDGTAAAGFGGYQGESMGSTWADFDGDGDLDPWVIQYGGWMLSMMEDDDDLLDQIASAPMRPFFRNRGDGTFEDLSDWLDLDDLRYRFAFVAGWYDMTGDAQPELFLPVDYRPEMNGLTNSLFRIGEGELIDIAEETATAFTFNPMGMSRGDINQDGRPDMLLSGINEFALLTSLDGGSWYDSALSRNLTASDEEGFEGWGTALVDIDNDGDLDAYATCGVVLGDLAYFFRNDLDPETHKDRGDKEPPNPTEQLDRLWLQDDDGQFQEKQLDGKWGLRETEIGRGVIFADFNQDGWLDILRRYMDRPATLHYARCGSEHWLQVELRDAGTPNPYAVGARIEVTVDGELQTRWIDVGSTGLGSGVPLSAHFGVGDTEQIDQLKVYWPDGFTSTFEELGVDRALTVERQRPL